MLVQKIAEGLWRWEVAHPDWKPEFDRPSGWGRMVASVYAELEDAVVLIDPLVPADAVQSARFWAALDRDVDRLGRPLLILVGCVDHGRSVDEVAVRYRERGSRVSVVGDAAIRAGVSCRLDGTFDEAKLPAGLRAIPIAGMSPGERVFLLRPWLAAVFADALIGAGEGEVRVAPSSWGVKTPEGQETYRLAFRPSFGPILESDPEVLLTSHGAPILAGGRAALAEALTAPAWGE